MRLALGLVLGFAYGLVLSFLAFNQNYSKLQRRAKS